MEEQLKKIEYALKDADVLEKHVQSVKNKDKRPMTKKKKKAIKKNGGKKICIEDLDRIAIRNREYTQAINKRIRMHKEWVENRRQNDFFEFNRKLFYRKLDCEIQKKKRANKQSSIFLAKLGKTSDVIVNLNPKPLKYWMKLRSNMKISKI